MKSVKRIARMTALAVAVCMLLTLSVFATETGRFWAAESSAEGEAVAVVMGTGVVTDGVVEMTYDADALSAEDLQVNEKYVAMYSVNAEEEGVLLIAWVAPGEIEIDGEDWLFKLAADDETEEDPTEEPVEGEDPTEAPADEEEEPTEESTEGATKPEGNKKPGSTGGNGSTGTGDNNRLVMLVVLAVACVAGIAAAAYVMLKGKKEGKA